MAGGLVVVAVVVVVVVGLVVVVVVVVVLVVLCVCVCACVCVCEVCVDRACTHKEREEGAMRLLLKCLPAGGQRG